MTNKLLYVGAKYDYGDKKRGLSYEHRNFHPSLHSWCRRQGWEMLHYDFYTRGQELGRDLMTQELRDLARREKPEFVFAVLIDFPLDPHHEVFSEIGKTGETTTLHWFCDDHWRFEAYSRHVAPHFHFVTTTASDALPKYAQAGLADRVIKTQWACNHELYIPYDIPQDIDASFVGQPHGDRIPFLNAVADCGLPVSVFGFGWQERPRLPFHQMVRLFSRSKINLNLSNSSTLVGQQIKGRNFEVPGAGGFLLSGRADNLDEYYEDGRETVTYESAEDLADKARFFLAHDDERRRIAEAGRRRTLAEHTWHHRYDQVFREIGRRAAAPTGSQGVATPPAVIDTALFNGEASPLEIAGARGFNFLAPSDGSRNAGWDCLLRAYVEEFAPDEDVCLIVRPSLPPGQALEDMAQGVDDFIAREMGRNPEQAPDIVLEASDIPLSSLPGLYAAADCCVLPARGAGWERPLLEAKAMGLPTIATDGADRRAFVTEDNGFLIRSEATTVPAEAAQEQPLSSGPQWVEPDIAHLRQLMRRAFTDRVAGLVREEITPERMRVAA